jgi:translation initiation factor 1 (eIF-1/SUI1)
MRFNSLKQRPRYFLSFTGLTVEEFTQLVAKIKQDWLNYQIERLNKNNPYRKRKIGGGRKKELSTLEDQLLLVLVWSKLYPAYLFLEYLFGIDESTICRTIQETLPILQSKFILPERRKGKKITSIEEFKEFFPDIDLDKILGDTTEQRIPRPEKKTKRKKHHSGKKKAFTMKTQLITNRQGIILYLPRASPGRTHDYKVFKESNLAKLISKENKVYLDSGYQGVQKDFPDLNAVIPHKRTRNHKELSRSQKIQNTKQRKIRVKIEHTISRLKKFRVLGDIYRHSLQNYNPAFRFVANIVNFRMLQRLQPV